MKTWKIVTVVLAQLLLSWAALSQINPPDPYFELDSWSFNDTNWISDYGCPPMSFTNVENPTNWDGNALEVDSTNPAWLQYPIVTSGVTNIMFGEGAICLWLRPNWNSGEGPGDWGRIVDVGEYGTNSPSSWWSLYFSPDGGSLNFSSETNGVFTNYFSCPISWESNTWHCVVLTFWARRCLLYIDGQFATNGAGMNYVPGSQAMADGFFVGSDVTGRQQARALIDDLATYNYTFDENDATNAFLAGWDTMNGITNQGNGGNGDGDGDGYNPPAVNYGTNLYLLV
ncbi:MAG: LamG-like jellyroll fold domain-containing protein, partial [Limisphaerales bacterium]